jgi:hypothetical protein
VYPSLAFGGASDIGARHRRSGHGFITSPLLVTRGGFVACDVL